MSRVVRVGTRVAALLAVLVGAAAPAWAQDAGIAGVAKDTSGAVLPGVTVTATSPVLIEQQRVAVTDGEGRFSITQLRPGEYKVTFTLSGFSTVNREGIRLAAGFTANVEAEMRVGSVEETITVTGASPVVDVQNVRRQTVVTNELLEALPTSTKSIGQLTTLTTGVTGLGDVGGTYQVEPGQDVVSGGGRFHGKGGTKVSYDGMGMENSSGNNSYQLNAASVEEMVMSTSGISADTNADGIVVNIVPKEGGNSFRTTIAGLYSNSSLEATNLTQELKDRGLQTANKTIKLFDESLSVGGPIKKDKLWFFVAPRTWGVSRTQAGVYWNKTQDVYLTPPGAEYNVVKWTPWVDRPEDRSSGRLEWYDSILSRVTWQATARNKFNVTYDEQRACNCGSVSSTQSQEYYLSSYRFEPNRLFQATWSSPVTSRLLLEAGTAATISQWNMFYQPGVNESIVSTTDLVTGQNYGAATIYLGHPNSRNRYTQRASMSYVTGSHNFKTGFQNELPMTSTLYHSNGNRNYYLCAGIPCGILQWSTPYVATSKTKYDLGIYAQDQWTVSNKLTVNAGLRWDGFNGYTPEQQINAPGQTADWPDVITTHNDWLPTATLAEKHNIPNWKDWSPRMGVAYDLFGNGKTAVKAQLGRYVSKLGTDLTEALNPIGTSVTAVTRGWNDYFYGLGDPRSGNYVPDCDLGNFGTNGECGTISNNNFGQNNPNATVYDPDVLNGYGKRDSNWDFSTEIQHELRPGFGVTGGYYWNNGGYTRQAGSRRRVTDNLLVTQSDYDTYCITAPSNPNLPGGGSYPVCGLANVSEAKYGKVQNFVTAREPFGEFESRNDFFNVAFDARLVHNIRLGGGVDTGRSVADNCFIVDSPQELVNCRVVTPFKAQTQLKAHGVFPLPAGFVTSFAYQNLSGPSYNATYTATAQQVAQGLGRAPSGGVTTVSGIPLVAPQTLFEDRVQRLDLRLSKAFQIQKFRIQANLDAYNALNASSIRAVNSTYGSQWRLPTQILDPRIIQLGGQITF